ncbi:MAG TPA: hypothetical protein VGN57_03780 [Pirellulaceae bacterium]|jgi:hypothetical protein|nr:hypothetical protein [Pirellulaceae bacterium]
MPGLRFPSSELLQFAIRQALIPTEIASLPVAGGRLEDGSVALFWHELPRRANLEPLEAIGAVRFGSPLRGIRPLSSVAEAIPLIPIGQEGQGDAGKDDAEQTIAIMFEFAAADGFASAAGELLRLGGDALAFAVVKDERTGRERRFLRVVRPSYFVVQRASEGDFGSVVIRSERSARFWAPLGYRHPLEDLLSPSIDAWTLVSETGPWETTRAPELSDVYDVVELSTPHDRESLTPIEPPRLRTPIRLTESGASEPAEFWTLRGQAIDRLHRFVQDHEQTLAGRLAFAVTSEEDPTVIIRTRPAPEGPPTISLDAIAYRSYLRIPNLFVPCGTQLRPRLRPDVIASRLAPRQDEITWLEPTAPGEFAPRTIPETAFQPLEEWIEYYLEREREPLAVWTRSMTFDFEPFVCGEDLAQGGPPSKSVAPPASPRKPTFDDMVEAQVASTKQASPRRRPSTEESAKAPFLAVDRDRDQALRRLHELEEAFVAFRSPPDSEERRDAWFEMADLHFALKRPHEGFVGWTAGAWGAEGAASGEIGAIAQGLLRSGEGADWVASLEQSDDRVVDAERARTLAAAAIVAGAGTASELRDQLRSRIRERLQAFVAALEAGEPYLPVRAVWLAWLGAESVAGEDVVRTALVRDRLLERVHRDGLRWDLDLPGFLRRTRQNDVERMRELADEIERIRRGFGDWLDAVSSRKDRPSGGSDARKGAAATLDYVRLIFAYADAALGQRERAEATLAEAGGRLRATGDLVHQWLADAFDFRIREAFEGRRSFQRLPASLMERLADLGTTSQYVANRARQKLKLLEPNEEVASFALWHQKSAGDDWALRVAKIGQEPQRGVRAQAMRDLWQAAQQAPPGERQRARTRTLAAALSMGPDFGASQTDWFLRFLPEVLASTTDLGEKARLWAPAVRTAAHFGRQDVVQSVVDEFERTLRGVNEADELIPIEPLIGDFFQDMRRFGLQGEIGRLFDAAESAARRLSNAKPAARSAPKRGRGPQETARRDEVALHTHRLELQIARGRFYFGQNDAAQATLERIERTLETSELKPVKQSELVQAYLQALSEAPSSVFLARVRRFFRTLPTGAPAIRISDEALGGTASHFQIMFLTVAESLVRAMFSGDPTQSQESRRYVEEDEFYFRDRVHRDLAQRLRRAQVE